MGGGGWGQSVASPHYQSEGLRGNTRAQTFSIRLLCCVFSKGNATQDNKPLFPTHLWVSLPTLVLWTYLLNVVPQQFTLF